MGLAILFKLDPTSMEKHLHERKPKDNHSLS